MTRATHKALVDSRSCISGALLLWMRVVVGYVHCDPEGGGLSFTPA